MIDIDAIEQRANAATPAPWRWEDTPGAGLQIFAPIPFKANCVEFTLKAAEQPVYTLLAYEKWLQFPPKEWNEMQRANAEFLSAARTDIPVLCKAVRELQAERDSTKLEVDACHKCWDDFVAKLVEVFPALRHRPLFQQAEMIRDRIAALEAERDRLRQALIEILTHEGLDENHCAMKSYEVVFDMQRIADEALNPREKGREE